jgi:2'-5' RNA ligase
MPTIGVTIALPEPWRTRLHAYRSAWDPEGAKIAPHITLLPPTDIEESYLPEVVRHLAAIAATTPPFEVHLAGTETFRPISPVVFVAVAGGVESLEALAGRVVRGPLGLELNYPYHPHVTVAHDVPESALDKAVAELADFDARFTVAEIRLSVLGEAGWVPTDAFGLAG